MEVSPLNNTVDVPRTSVRAADPVTARPVPIEFVNVTDMPFVFNVPAVSVCARHGEDQASINVYVPPNALIVKPAEAWVVFQIALPFDVSVCDPRPARVMTTEPDPDRDIPDPSVIEPYTVIAAVPSASVPVNPVQSRFLYGLGMSIVMVPEPDEALKNTLSWQSGALAPLDPPSVADHVAVADQFPAATMCRSTGVVNVTPVLPVASAIEVPVTGEIAVTEKASNFEVDEYPVIPCDVPVNAAF